MTVRTKLVMISQVSVIQFVKFRFIGVKLQNRSEKSKPISASLICIRKCRFLFRTHSRTICDIIRQNLHTRCGSILADFLVCCRNRPCGCFTNEVEPDKGY